MNFLYYFFIDSNFIQPKPNNFFDVIFSQLIDIIDTNFPRVIYKKLRALGNSLINLQYIERKKKKKNKKFKFITK
jgi:hypothetical protein